MENAHRERAELRLGYTLGTTPAKWSRAWRERFPRVHLELVPLPENAGHDALSEHDLDAALLRSSAATPAMHAVVLYSETLVLVVERDNTLAEAGDVTVADLDGLTIVAPGTSTAEAAAIGAPPVSYSPADAADTLEYVATGAAATIMPQPLARALSRKDVVALPITDATGSDISLVWSRDDDSEMLQELVGVTRGRKANSSRGTPTPPAEPQAPAKAKGKPAQRQAKKPTRFVPRRTRKPRGR